MLNSKSYIREMAVVDDFSDGNYIISTTMSRLESNYCWILWFFFKIHYSMHHCHMSETVETWRYFTSYDSTMLYCIIE